VPSKPSNKRLDIQLRAVVSLVTAWGFLVMSLTGFVLYIEPHGRVAYWCRWTLLGLGKEQWDAVHVVASVLFVLAGAVHLAFNWRTFVRFLWRRIDGAGRLRRELGISVAVILVVVASAIGHFPPLGYLIDLNEWAKESWVSGPADDPPFGHAEMHSLTSFARKMNLDLDAALPALEASGITVSSPEQTLDEISRINQITPAELYGELRPHEAASRRGSGP
jgi:hypothetical protein